ncbi:MAG: hypothetical protein HY549_11965 [Elusimicrobia bacterium]|nr:hypothetical protein [Elusimicrobiota bacterium]
MSLRILALALALGTGAGAARAAGPKTFSGPKPALSTAPRAATALLRKAGLVKLFAASEPGLQTLLDQARKLENEEGISLSLSLAPLWKAASQALPPEYGQDLESEGPDKVEAELIGERLAERLKSDEALARVFARALRIGLNQAPNLAEKEATALLEWVKGNAEALGKAGTRDELDPLRGLALLVPEIARLRVTVVKPSGE